MVNTVGNAKHSRVTSSNYKASERDDAAHIDYLKRDVNYDAKHGHSDIDMTADEKHISKLAGDMKYDKKHHGMSRESSRAERLRDRAMKRSEKTGAERGDSYDYEDPRVMKMLQKANELDERSNARMMNKMGVAADVPGEAGAYVGGPNRMTGHGQSKGDQSATHTDYAHYKGTDKGYHGHTGASHGDQSATHRDYMSPLHNTGWSGFNYNKTSAELDYMPIEHDMHRGMSRLASPLNAKGDKCPESGCVQEKGNGKWGVISGKTGKWWDANYDSRSSAEAGLRAYFANGGN